jgi:hypothetical protein
MKRTDREKIAVAGMFVLVITVFSLASRDTKKIYALYTKSARITIEQPKTSVQSGTETIPVAARFTRN